MCILVYLAHHTQGCATGDTETGAVAPFQVSQRKALPPHTLKIRYYLTFYQFFKVSVYREESGKNCSGEERTKKIATLDESGSTPLN